jgi:DNA adenine methylase
MSKSIQALAPWFGANRTLAKNVGKVLEGHSWVCVPFAGGMSELYHITAPTILVSDVHRHIINLANVAKHSGHRAELIRLLDRTLVHPDQLKESQQWCKRRETGENDHAWFDWAYHYFVSAWMSRNGTAGTKGEFDAGISVRWKDGGGDSCVRFRNATEGLEEFGKIAKRCTFVVEDCWECLSKCHDLPKHAIYVDAPWPDDGDNYANPFTEDDQVDLAARLAKPKKSRVVVRFGDHPLIRKLYPENEWTWNMFTSRDQHNQGKREVLLVRN